MTTAKNNANTESDIKRWDLIKERVWKNTDSILPTVDFDLSFGGLLIIRGMVSRIEVLEGMIEAPLEEVSQY
jgi:hypothetical protein